MKRLLGTGLSILLFSALTATGAKASENRLEYQLHLTHHPVPTVAQIPTQPAATEAKPISMSVEKPQAKPEQPQSEIKPVRSGNPYSQSSRPLWDPINNTILPIH